MTDKKSGGCCGGSCSKPAQTEKKAGCCGGVGFCACKAGGTQQPSAGGCCSDKPEFDPTKPLTDEQKKELEELINTGSMTCFIKGSPSEPRCKFSKQLLRFLMDNNITKLAYHDILEDTFTRDALKVYSNWKTYPQIYVQGKLLGGIDAVKDLHAKGQFLDKIPKECFGKGLYPRIRKIIDQQHVMLFMQGTPQEAKNDEDKQAVTILKETGVEFGYFDVSAAEDIAKGAPTYARFTGYPQLFVGGELLGGLSFLQEKQSQSKLADLLKKPTTVSTTSTAMDTSNTKT
jgi:glutaredoxin-related protein